LYIIDTSKQATNRSKKMKFAIENSTTHEVVYECNSRYIIWEVFYERYATGSFNVMTQ